MKGYNLNVVNPHNAEEVKIKHLFISDVCKQNVHYILTCCFRGYSFLVMKIKSLTSLGLRSLQRINAGNVYITGNKNLCYYNTVNWTRIWSTSSSPQRWQTDIKENRSPEECGEWHDSEEFNFFNNGES